MEKCIIAAVADNGAIGEGGTLPWHISEDLKFFKKTTISCPVIMGRKTFLSLGRPLPGRKNIVLSRSLAGAVKPTEEVVFVPSLDEAYKAAEPAERCFVIGGAMVYSLAIEDADKLYITEVHTRKDGADAFFPSIDPALWKETSRSEMKEDAMSGLRFEFVEYGRK